MPVALSGSFDTGQLPRIAGVPVTVTVARTVAPGFEAQYLRWTEEVVATLRTVHGCLGAGVLHPGPDGGEHQIVFRFINGVTLREWERSAQRQALMANAQSFVLSERVQRTVGVDAWFELPTRAEPKRPLWGRILTDVAWVFPVAIASGLLIGPHVGSLPFLLRASISTLAITVAMRMAVGPVRSRLRARRTL